MDKQGRDNRANQKNPNFPAAGPGKAAGWHGDSNQKALDNHGNQLNPNHSQYGGGQGGHRK